MELELTPVFIQMYCLRPQMRLQPVRVHTVKFSLCQFSQAMNNEDAQTCHFRLKSKVSVS